jgi:small subunit ribosomal protein S1
MSLSIKQLDKNPWESLNTEFKVGQRIKGIISNITDFGIFVQIKPGIDGLVHISDLSWTEHINHPADIYKKTQEVEAVILGIDEANKKVSLGIKQLAQDPWEAIEQEYPRNKIVEGTVSKITNFGAFIRLPTGIEGLVHISELADHNVEKVEDILQVGQKYQFRVINVNREEHKLGLSLKLDASDDRAPRKEASRRAPEVQKTEKKAETTQKPKSQLQLELEKHLNEKKGS